MNMRKIALIGIIPVLVILGVLLFVVKNSHRDIPEANTKDISIIGTWYSDKPDKLTFTEESSYQASDWNGGNAWLTSGSYTIDGKILTLSSTLDGTTQLLINTSDGMTISGKYTYYRTAEEANKMIVSNESEQVESAENIIPDTINNLLGLWTSLDGSTTCTFTDTSFIIHFKGNEAVPADELYYEYEVISDKQMIVKTDGSSNTYPYELYTKDGVLYFASPIKSYAGTYIKGEVETLAPELSSYQAQPTATPATSTIIRSEKNPDVSSYTEDMAAVVDSALIGTWEGSFDDIPDENSVTWVYTFNNDGTYYFSNGETSENGDYTTIHDSNDNNYNSTLTLMHDGTVRTIKFYLSGSAPIRMITDDQTDPTFIKQCEGNIMGDKKVDEFNQ